MDRALAAPVASSAPSSQYEPALLPAIEWAKALAIVAVIVTHAGPFSFAPTHPIDYAVRAVVVAFHVPVFLLVSGYLHASATPLTLARIWARLRRVLGPYLFASLAVTVFGLSPQATWRDLPWNLALAGAVPIYYYVLVWCGCALSGLVWSRLSAPGLLVALALVVLASEWRSWHPTWSFFWAVRDPLLQGWACCYLGGWCARRFGWVDIVRRYPLASLFFAVAGSVPWVFRTTTTIATDLRLLYSASVAVAIVTVARTAPKPIRWLSRETLWIYLAHLPVLEVFLRFTEGWPPASRIAVATSLTLGTCAVGITLWRTIQQRLRRDGTTAGLPPRRQTPLPAQSAAD